MTRAESTGAGHRHRQQACCATGVEEFVDFISIAPLRGASARNCLRHLYLATCGLEGNSSTPRHFDLEGRCGSCHWEGKPWLRPRYSASRRCHTELCAMFKPQPHRTTDAGTSYVVDRVQQDILSHKRCVPGMEIVAPIPGFKVDAAVCRPEIGGPRSSLFDRRSQEEEKDQRHRPMKELRQGVIEFVIPAVTPRGPLCCTSGSLSARVENKAIRRGCRSFFCFLSPQDSLGPLL